MSGLVTVLHLHVALPAGRYGWWEVKQHFGVAAHWKARSACGVIHNQHPSSLSGLCTQEGEECRGMAHWIWSLASRHSTLDLSLWRGSRGRAPEIQQESPQLANKCDVVHGRQDT